MEKEVVRATHQLRHTFRLLEKSTALFRRGEMLIIPLERHFVIGF